MGKVGKSAAELAKLIRSRLAEPKLRVAVYPKSRGWRAKVYAEKSSARHLQKRVDEVAQELSRVYDLEG